MTERLYYTDSYLRAFDAVVTRSFEHAGRPAVTLDRTAFYPTSGGQPFDTGRLDQAAVLETLDLDGHIAHVLSAPLVEGARVRGDIDWARRFDHMQQHTGQHVLSAAFERVAASPTVGFHLGGEVATIDVAREVTSADVERAEDAANHVVWEDCAVAIRFVPSADAAALPLRKEPAREGLLRLVDVADFDLSACGGTHVERTGAIGLVAVLGWERARGGARVTFACGGRALVALRRLRDAVAGSVRALSVVPDELPAAIVRLQAEARDQSRAIREMQDALWTHEAAQLLSEAPEINGVRVIARVMERRDAAGLKATASLLTASGRAAVALMTDTLPAQVVVSRSADVSVDANAVLRQILATFGGKGGGKPDLAQGGGLAGDVHAMAAAARGLLEDAISGRT